MKKIGKILITALLILVMTAGLIVPGTAAGKAPKNIIIMIGDGVGYNQILAANYYLYGEANAHPYADFPVQLAMSTYSKGQSQGTEDDDDVIYNPNNWQDTIKFGYGATDSAAAATAMSTGTKTWDAAVGLDQNKSVITHLYENFEALGKSTGIVTTVPFNHATPAGFSTHHDNRDDYLVLADQQLKLGTLDVMMGCGHPWFDDFGLPRETFKAKYISEETYNGIIDGTLDVADADGDGAPDPWTMISAKADFETLQTGDTPDRVFGLAEVHTTLQEYRIVYTPDADIVNPYAVPRIENVPTLEVMAKGALNVLDNNKNGFFMMIEGGAPDWAGHFFQTGSLIEEMEDFYNAVEAVKEWVEKNSSWDETLLIVTGDHETGFLSGSEGKLTPVTGNGKGKIPNMYWNLANRDRKWIDFGWHSNQLVPFYAKGCGAELYYAVADQNDPVRGKYLDNTEISLVIRELCGIKDSYLDDVKSAMDEGLVPYGLQNYMKCITREDFCLLVYQTLNKAAGVQIKAGDADVNTPMPFTDVTNGNYNVIYTLNQLGIISGASPTEFNPNGLLTREQAATILSNVAKYLEIPIPKTTVNYADKASISSWAANGVADMSALGIMGSTGGNNFSPKADFTGQQAIMTMLRIYNLVKA